MVLNIFTLVFGVEGVREEDFSGGKDISPCYHVDYSVTKALYAILDLSILNFETMPLLSWWKLPSEMVCMYSYHYPTGNLVVVGGGGGGGGGGEEDTY